MQKTDKRKKKASAALLDVVNASLEDSKAIDIITLTIDAEAALSDYMILASGTSSRHVIAIANHLEQKIKDKGFGRFAVNGKTQGDWVLIDAGDIIIHIFRPEIRLFYNLEKLWGTDHHLKNNIGTD